MAKVNPIQLEKFLQNLDYPATKEDILECARQNGADEDAMETLNMLPERQYEGPVGISKEVGELE